MAKNQMTAVRTPRTQKTGDAIDVLMVQSVEKAFRVLSVFDGRSSGLSLSQIAVAAKMDISGAQRFTHTLTKLGYLRRVAETKQFELTPKSLQLGYHYLRSNQLIERAIPYLMHLSIETEESVNLTIQEEAEIVFVVRFMSRYMLNTSVIVGSRMPMYCTAPGIAILSAMPEAEALDILQHSDLKPVTPSTTWKMDDLIEKLRISRKRGYATTFGEFYHGDASIAAPVLDVTGRPAGAVNIGVSLARYSPHDVVRQFAPTIVSAANSISRL